jgi:uncharacterized membrane-anchored protein YjiN (DUF445 family)
LSIAGRVAPDARQTRMALRSTRMRLAATCLLACMTLLLFACFIGQARYPDLAWLAWLRSFAEAGTVGALADWYAVVALFRHPLGVPMPHTAIIPRNQQRIAESLGSFVEAHFLAPDLVTERLKRHNPAQALAHWLADRRNSESIADALVGTLPALLDAIDETDVARCIDRTLIPQLRTLDVSRAAGQMLNVFIDENRHQPLVEGALQALERWLVEHAGLLKAKFSEASRYTPARFDGYIVDRFVEGIVTLVHEVVGNPQHALRAQLDDALRDFVEQLRTSRAHRRYGRSLMRDCIRHFRKEANFRAMLNCARTRVADDLDREHPVLRSAATGLLMSMSKGIDGAPSLQHKLNAWWLELAHALVVRYRGQFPAMITEIVTGWDAKEVVRKIEAEIGRDLQFIRINGTLVGGAAGVLLHAAACIVMR